MSGKGSALMRYRYLVLGDGNFSFSLSLARRRQEEEDGGRLVATSFESREKVLTRPGAEESMRALNHARGAEILHEVDATRLETCRELHKRGPSFDTIIFNFPHSGGKSRIERNRKLLQEFFVSLSNSDLLSRQQEKGGEVHVTLCRGQGGTGLDSSQRSYNDSWKVVEQASEGGFVLDRVEPFLAESYPGYVPTGYRGHTDRGFKLEGAVVHVFRYPSPVRDALSPAVYKHDVSFWCEGEAFDKEAFGGLVTEVVGEYVVDMVCVDEYHQNSGDRRSHGGGCSLHCFQGNDIGCHGAMGDCHDNISSCHGNSSHGDAAGKKRRVSYCYRLTYSSCWDALSRTRARQLQENLRTSLKETMGVELR